MKILSLVGAVGVGKTFYGRQLVNALPNTLFIEEDTSKNLYLEEFYADMKKWGFHSRISMLSMIAENIVKIDKSKDFIIYDRYIHELIVFATKEYDEGNMAQKEYALYIQLYNSICSLTPTPDLFIYMRCSPEISLRRIKQRNRNCEKGVDLNFCLDVLQRYDKWANAIASNEILIINTDHEIPIEKLKNKILQKLKC